MMKKTSKEAYSKARDTIIPTHHKKILQAMKVFGKCTTHTLSVYAKMDYHAVARRMSELEKKGLIVAVCRRIDIDGSTRTVYELVKNESTDSKAT